MTHTMIASDRRGYKWVCPQCGRTVHVSTFGITIIIPGDEYVEHVYPTDNSDADTGLSIEQMEEVWQRFFFFLDEENLE